MSGCRKPICNPRSLGWSRSTDITTVDLRLPDRITVRLSDAAAQARDEAIKANAKKKKGGDA
jgi:cell division protein FtsQ